MEIAGGAIVGYCATGSLMSAKRPASMVIMAITHANIGLSIKNLGIDHRLLIEDPSLVQIFQLMLLHLNFLLVA